jgi:hypothetical protein
MADGIGRPSGRDGRYRVGKAQPYERRANQIGPRLVASNGGSLPGLPPTIYAQAAM